jgi:hypothetical protein
MTMMREVTAKLCVGYVVLCEWLTSALLSFGLISFWKDGFANQNEQKVIDGTMFLMVATIGFVAGWGLIRRYRWAWFLSLPIGFAVAWFGVGAIRQAGGPSPYVKMEGGFLFGTGVLLLSLSIIGLTALLLPSTRKLFFRDDLAPAASLRG